LFIKSWKKKLRLQIIENWKIDEAPLVNGHVAGEEALSPGSHICPLGKAVPVIA
jgi:hypothetical protein